MYLRRDSNPQLYDPESYASSIWATEVSVGKAGLEPAGPLRHRIYSPGRYHYALLSSAWQHGSRTLPFPVSTGRAHPERFIAIDSGSDDRIRTSNLLLIRQVRSPLRHIGILSQGWKWGSNPILQIHDLVFCRLNYIHQLWAVNGLLVQEVRFERTPTWSQTTCSVPLSYSCQ